MSAKLTGSQLASWSRDGWLVLRGEIPERMLDDLDLAVARLARWADEGGPGLHHFEQTESGPALARSERFVELDETLRSFVCSGSLLDLVSELLGEPAVLFKEKVNYKQPGGAGFAPHQDATAYRFVDHHISVMVPLDPSTVASGCLEFAHGHQQGRLDTDERGCIADEVSAVLDWRPVEVGPGDLVLFDSYAPHRSGTNASKQARRALYLTYNARRYGDMREQYYADKQAEFERLGHTFGGERARISISDDFLGRPVSGPV